MIRAVFLSLTALIAAGCASTQANRVQTPARYVAEPANCVVSVADVIPTTMAVRRRKPVPAVDLANVATCVRSGSGAIEPVLLYDISVGEYPAIIKAEVIPSESRIVAVKLALLDDNRQVLRDVPFDAFRRRGRAHTYTLYLNSADSDARYLLVRPDLDWLGKSDVALGGDSTVIPLVVPVAGGAAFASLVVGSEEKHERVFSEVGKFRLWVEGDAPRSAAPD